ncbi:hypothetical protein DES34_109151 [Brevibacillus brevis]|nr:hypothetical protein DES34_109151 [Brevibacillus brevis]TQK53923.1 hypothetical protein FB479_108138 [Brevibacillus sp. AG162]GEC88696.1 hypothetical protein BBR01nite_10270 [Brevibacillus brevis]VEF86896.1 Uncharacterised protein [Brevibacillus brevis]
MVEHGYMIAEKRFKQRCIGGTRKERQRCMLKPNPYPSREALLRWKKELDAEKEKAKKKHPWEGAFTL